MKLLLTLFLALTLFGCSKKDESFEVTYYCYLMHGQGHISYISCGVVHDEPITTNEATFKIKTYPEDLQKSQQLYSDNGFPVDSVYMSGTYNGKTVQQGWRSTTGLSGGIDIQLSQAK